MTSSSVPMIERVALVKAGVRADIHRDGVVIATGDVADPRDFLDQLIERGLDLRLDVVDSHRQAVGRLFEIHRRRSPAESCSERAAIRSENRY